MTTRAPTAETAIAVDFPFVRTVGQRYCDDRSTGPDDRFLSWRPGIDWQPSGSPYAYGDEEHGAVANGMGKILLTEIDRHELPKPYQARVFYTRQWQDPDGRVYGKKQLRIITAGGFTSLCNGWRHEFALDPDAVPDDVVAFEKECQ